MSEARPLERAGFGGHSSKLNDARVALMKRELQTVLMQFENILILFVLHPSSDGLPEAFLDQSS